MNPADLIAPASPLGAPAPYGLLVFFKVLGFTLHMIFMNLWYAGIPVALVVSLRGGTAARAWSRRIMLQMPVIIALGVNLGIVPLLFVQVSYHRVFYPATILMAWAWFSIIPLLTVAYYGVYIYAAALKKNRLSGWRRAAGWVSAGLFLVMGLIFTRGFSLMADVRAWIAVWHGTDVAGAVNGLGWGAMGAAFWARWLLVPGLGLLTTAAHVMVDAGLLAGPREEEYRRAAPAFALRMALLALVWIGAAGAWYMLAGWRPEVRAAMFTGPRVALTVVTALSPALTVVAILAARRGATPRMAFFAAGAQLMVLALNAVSRQVVQNLELAPFFDPAAGPVHTQWSPLVLFLILFVAGLGLIGWMVSRMVVAGRQPA